MCCFGKSSKIGRQVALPSREFVGFDQVIQVDAGGKISAHAENARKLPQNDSKKMAGNT